MATNGKLIDASALLEKVQFRIDAKGVAGAAIKDAVEITRRLIKDAPAVDAVKVVRCMACDWYDPDDGTCCVHFDERGEPQSVLSTGYCSDGERRSAGG